LLLARATARQREIAVRLSLGAARWRVVRQLLTESVLLALVGAATGLLFARWLTAGLMKMLNTGRNPVDLAVTADGHVLLFTITVAVLCGVAFGLAPALRVIAVDIFPVLKQSQTQVVHGGQKFVPGKVLVGGQVALCVLLLVSAGLFSRTLRRLQHVQLGFDPQNLISFRVQPGLNGYKGARLISYYTELQRRLESIPGVRKVGLAEIGPIGAGQSSMELPLPGYTEPHKPAKLHRHVVDAEYFNTLGIPVLTGRGILPSDVEGAKEIAVVNQKAAARYFHGDSPIGHTIELGSDTKHALVTIVGVVGNTKYNSIRDDFPPTVYFAYPQRPKFATMMTFLVRTSGDERSVAAAIQKEAAAVDKDVPVLNLRTESEILSDVLVMERILAMLSGMLAALALLLACVGLYGTIGYTVVRRTNEIGIRMALGAARENILVMVLRETVVVVAAGVLVGLPAAWFATRVLKAQLFELSPHDPFTIAIAVGAIVLVTLLSGFMPARRASRVDPMVALRCE
jgi:predicted permease